MFAISFDDALEQSVAILRTARNQKAAKAFVDFLISEEGQKLAVGQGYLMAAWEQAFRRHGLQVAQVLLTGGDLADRREHPI